MSAEPRARRQSEVEARPSVQREQRRRPDLRVISARDLVVRARLRRVRLLALLSASLVLVALLVVAATQAYVDAQQVRLDTLDNALSSAVQANQGLQLRHAELSSPSRVLDIAEHRLGMVVPNSVTYLAAVPPARSRNSTSTQPASSRSERRVARGGAGSTVRHSTARPDPQAPHRPR